MADLIRREKLSLVQVEEMKFKSKTTGEEVTTFKHLFFTPSNEVKIGYLSSDKFAILAVPNGEYQEANAKLWAWKGREWDGKMVFKLSEVDPLPIAK